MSLLTSSLHYITMTCKLTECVHTQYKQQKVEACLCVRLCNPPFWVYITHYNINSTINWCIQWAILLMFNDTLHIHSQWHTEQHTTLQSAWSTNTITLLQNLKLCDTKWNSETISHTNDGMISTISHAILHTVFGWQCNKQGFWPPCLPD